MPEALLFKGKEAQLQKEDRSYSFYIVPTLCPSVFVVCTGVWLKQVKFMCLNLLKFKVDMKKYFT